MTPFNSLNESEIFTRGCRQPNNMMPLRNYICSKGLVGHSGCLALYIQRHEYCRKGRRIPTTFEGKLAKERKNKSQHVFFTLQTSFYLSRYLFVVFKRVCKGPDHIRGREHSPPIWSISWQQLCRVLNPNPPPPYKLLEPRAVSTRQKGPGKQDGNWEQNKKQKSKQFQNLF